MILEQANPSFILSHYIDLKVCDNLVKEFNNVEDVANYDKFRGYYRVNDRTLPSPIIDSYLVELQKCTKLYKDTYPWSYIKNDEWGVMSPFNIQKYPKGKSYSTEHIEEHGPTKDRMLRHLTFLTYLNDIKEGGETEFILHNLLVKPKKGLTVIFPAGWTHPHRGHPAPKEEKYITTGWYSYFHRC